VVGSVTAVRIEKFGPDYTAVVEARVWPRITLVTAVYNGVRYIEDTIRSIVSQGYPNLEYIVVDGASTDGTVEIIRKYEQHLAWWVSEPDQGVYSALNKGFERSTGEIMGWLNSSDLLHTNGLFVVGSVFAAFQEVDWITGRPTKFNPKGMAVDVLRLPRWSRSRFLAGANKYIQQESTFWRRGLWNRAGGALGTSYKAAGDFELWVRFFRHARLYPVDALIGGYRFHEDSLSWSEMEGYNRICDELVDRELKDRPGAGAYALRFFRGVTRAVKPIPKVRGIWHRGVVNNLYRLPGPDSPPRIVEEGAGWVMRK
jgi:glycosyltransferase involved in cell wall biosynthesis